MTPVPGASPDGEVSFNRHAGSVSNAVLFKGVPVLPEALNAARYARCTTPARPTEMSALALRLRAVRLDRSPESDRSSCPEEGTASPKAPAPTVGSRRIKLDFDDDDDTAEFSDKENVDTAQLPTVNIASGQPIAATKSLSVFKAEVEKDPALGERSFGDQVETDQNALNIDASPLSSTSLVGKPKVSPKPTDVAAKTEKPTTACADAAAEAPFNDDSHSADNKEVKTSDADIDVSQTACADDSSALEAPTTCENVQAPPIASDVLDEPVVHEGEATARLDETEEVHALAEIASALPNCGVTTADAQVPVEQVSIERERNSSPNHEPDFAQPLGHILEQHSIRHEEKDSGMVQNCPGETTMSDREAANDSSPAKELQKIQVEAAVSGDMSDFDEAAFAMHLNKILEGPKQWGWQDRCEAMVAVCDVLEGTPPERVAPFLTDKMSLLTDKIIAQFDELRPSVITGALTLTRAVIAAGLANDSDFTREVCPSVVDLACGRSITAHDAGRCLADILAVDPSLVPLLAEADNPDRLREVLQVAASAKEQSELVQTNATLALQFLSDDSDETAQGPGPASACTHDSDTSLLPTNLKVVGDLPIEPSSVSEPETPTSVPDNTKIEATPVRSRSSTLEDSSSSQGTNEASMHSEGDFAVTPSRPLSLTERTPFEHGAGTPGGMSNLKNATDRKIITPAARNMRLSSSTRKISPGTLRKRRMYTEDEMEEARRVSMRVAMEETNQAHAKERQKHADERSQLESQLAAEKQESKELKIVLEQFEAAMVQMCAQKDPESSKAISAENKRLQKELHEHTTAFADLKERYDKTKQDITVFEDKETRFVDQIHDMKEKYASLQKWSTDLKANTEKKLSAAFDTVSKFRSSYLDKEAHATKAISDLQRVKLDLDRELAEHSKTSAKLAIMESKLNKEQDARVSAESSLSTAKQSLLAMTTIRDDLQRESDGYREQISVLKAETERLCSFELRSKESVMKVASLVAESHTLKARAYDDMTRIKSLEAEIVVKSKECEELGSICEEVVGQLEAQKLGRSATKNTKSVAE